MGVIEQKQQIQVNLLITMCYKYIEDIYLFKVNIKYISSSVLKTSKIFKSKNKNVLNSLDEIYLVFTPKK